MKKIIRVRCLKSSETQHTLINCEKRNIRTRQRCPTRILNNNRNRQFGTWQNLCLVRHDNHLQIQRFRRYQNLCVPNAILRQCVLFTTCRCTTNNDNGDKDVRRVHLTYRNPNDGII